MKKLLGALLLIGLVFILVACSSGLDGKYYMVRKTGEVSDGVKLEIKDKTMTYHYGDSDLIYSIDEDKKVMIGKSKSEPYDYQDGLLKFGGSEYVKEGTDKYEELKKK